MINTQAISKTMNNSMLDICGEFSYNLLKKNNLLEIAENIFCLKSLNRSQAETLLNVPLPFLLKLAEIRKPPPNTDLLTPVLYLPLASSLEKSSSLVIAEVFSEEIQLHLKTFKKLSIALDQLETKFDQAIFIETLENIFSKFPKRLEIYSLSARTISTTPSPNRKNFITFLQQYSNKITINSLTPSELKLIKDAGFDIAYVQTLSSSTENKKNRDKTFLDQLSEIQKKLSPNLESWQPQFNYELDKLPLQENAALGLEILSKICLARLVLPHTKQIKAPLSILGSKLANVALEFGATHLGFAAVDENSAKNLQLPLYQRTLKEIENV